MLIVAPDLIGKILVSPDDCIPESYTITEVEAYRGEEDEASHARFGKTARNSIMYDREVWYMSTSFMVCTGC